MKSLSIYSLNLARKNWNKNMNKSLILLMLLAGLSLASAYTSEQQATLEGMRLSFQLGAAYQGASQGQSLAEFNTLIDEYNAWIRQNFGEDPSLLMSKMNIATANSLNPMPMPQYLTGVMQRRPFNTSSDLSKFGKQEVLTQISPGNAITYEADSAMAKLENF
jgi:hypothetical protein